MDRFIQPIVLPLLLIKLKELDIMNAEEYRAYRTVSNPLSDMGADSDWFDAVTQLG